MQIVYTSIQAERNGVRVIVLVGRSELMFGYDKKQTFVDRVFNVISNKPYSVSGNGTFQE